MDFRGLLCGRQRPTLELELTSTLWSAELLCERSSVREIQCARDPVCERSSVREIQCARDPVCERSSVRHDSGGASLSSTSRYEERSFATPGSGL
jgi:hypothetical protein